MGVHWGDVLPALGFNCHCHHCLFGSFWIYTAANISGGHLNPAVTPSMAICGFFPVVHSVVYVILQIVGAILGAVITAFLVPEMDHASERPPGGGGITGSPPWR